MVFTTSAPTGELRDGLVFCRISSWVTGRRLVSLPFSDHCELLCDSPDNLGFLIRYLKTTLQRGDWRYLEIRPIDQNFLPTADKDGLMPAASYFLHVIDLRPDLRDVFQRLDKDSVQRRINRAEQAGLIEKCGTSKDLLKDFYTLFLLTRGRHRVPPTPYAWFQNLIRHQGKALEIRLACQGKTPIAAILTLRFRHTVYFKYGCADSRFNKFGGMPWLLWRAIQAGKANGATRLDMGRTEEENTGLLTFKNHWVAQPQRLVYWRFPQMPSAHSANGWKLKMAKRVFSSMPSKLRMLAGGLIYRHIG
jgi:lipid II:glycine glycyltransferase (peptidoglycan interpeptide bridge formation enzyme)